MHGVGWRKNREQEEGLLPKPGREGSRPGGWHSMFGVLLWITDWWAHQCGIRGASGYRAGTVQGQVGGRGPVGTERGQCRDR